MDDGGVNVVLWLNWDNGGGRIGSMKDGIVNEFGVRLRVHFIQNK